MWSGVFIAEGVDGVGDMGSGDTTVDVQTHLEVFLNMSVRSACFSDSFFLVRRKTWSWDFCPQAADCQCFQIIGCHMKGILLYIKVSRAICGKFWKFSLVSGKRS